MDSIKRKNLSTEKQNINSQAIDSKSIAEILHIINSEDQRLSDEVKKAIPEIEQTILLTRDAIKNGHRIYYIGAGTSGRLGVLDASEIPPTFSAPNHFFNGIIAGGDKALRNSIEGVEDESETAINDLQLVNLKANDVIIGISASGAAKYVKSALDYGISIGAKTVYLICNSEPFLPVNSDIIIKINTGPEVITGSTRMKAGTATKMVLNMISTTTMIQLGKVYDNLMIDLMAVNEKLIDRGTRIIVQLTGVDYQLANSKLLVADKSVKTAIVMIKYNCSRADALIKLNKSEGFLRKLL
ncbi:MAG: N-acetylmuramic acid 6-phosphate etherase [Fidelibacterota bacterium]|mgnify:CR=1 FL=1|jgi:N-acetylmuramic acid 6-phosphate etherase|tara:strand:- start:52 stop:948 length:897 start_codon:yes stop_codon:yes gene_type:complete